MVRTNLPAALLVVVAISTAVVGSCKDGQQAGDGPIRPLQEYTGENAREWTDIAKEHVPHARHAFNNGRDAVIIEVPLAKANEGHYVEKIGVMDMAGKELAVQTIKRERNPLRYAYFDKSIIPWSGKVKVFAKCNQHDLWIKEIPVRELGI